MESSNTKSIDRIREIKQEIDAFVLRHHWQLSPLPYSVWYLLALHEAEILDDELRFYRGEISAADRSVYVDHAKNALKHCVTWACRKAPTQQYFKRPTYVHARRFGEVRQFWQLGLNYQAVETAYFNYNRGAAEAELVSSRTVRFTRSPLELSYDALSNLLHARREEKAAAGSYNVSDFKSALQRVHDSVRLQDSHAISFDIQPGVVRTVAESLAEGYDVLFDFPEKWSFEGIPIQLFREVWRFLKALCVVHKSAHIHAMLEHKCLELPVLSLVMLTERGEVQAQLATESKVISEEEGATGRILDFMTCHFDPSACKIDPALQPLAPLTASTTAIAPSLVISSNIERNTLAVLARDHRYRDEYSRDSHLLEKKLISEISNKLGSSYLHVTSKKRIPGSPDLPDIDLAVFDNQTDQVLLVELKWPLGPVESQEIFNRGLEAEKKGIDQIEQVLDYSQQHPQALWATCFPKLPMPRDLRFQGCVAIRGFCGSARNWNPRTPVIEESLFTEALLRFNNLEELWDWMARRAFLPKEDIDYRRTEFPSPVADYTVIWEGYEILPDHKWLEL